MKSSYFKIFKGTLLGACVITSALQAEDKNLEAKVAELEGRLEALSEKLEDPKKTSLSDRVHWNGYGELHVNQLKGEGGLADKKEIDLHRFVLGAQVDFTQKIRFVSEIEIEHAVTNNKATNTGEVEIEQAYIELDLAKNHRLKTGVFLVPIGLMNETHEPPAFYGVERNVIETNILPSTWWEGGVGLSGDLGQGWNYDLALTSGLSSDNTFALRGARQKVSSAPMENPASTARIRYKGLPGLEVGATIQYQSDIRQKRSASTTVSALVYETHVDYRRGPYGIKALYAGWDIDGTSTVAGMEDQRGYYIEPSYRIIKPVGVFYRYNDYDNAAGKSGTSGKVQHDVGVNYWPHESVVFKADYQYQNNENGKDLNGFNVGVGYAF